jgi:nucleotide-binding universal stress UspA family protein
VLSQNLFTIIVAMALITTTAMPPTLRWALGRLPLRREEKLRLEREDYERNAFVPNIERVLLAIDGSANGKFASHLTGLLAGSRGMPVTILEIASQPPDKPEDESAARAKAVRAGAKQASANEKDVPKVDVIVRQPDSTAEEAIAREAQRGYDLLVVGIEHTAVARGGFHDELSRLVGQFEGSVAIVVARGAQAETPDASPQRVLIPVTGNENSCRGAEVALTITKSAGAQAVALSVVHHDAKNKQRLRREAKVVADEIKRIATHLKATARTEVRSDTDAEESILKAIARGKHDLVVMGVSRRPGDKLSFGDVADILLKQADCSLVFVAPQTRGAPKSTPKGGDKPAAA